MKGLQSNNIKDIEREIIQTYNNVTDYVNHKHLLTQRQELLNRIALTNQSTLLPIIIEFNDELRKALFEMYTRTHRIWNDVRDKTDYGNEIELKACCFLDYEYPTLHPIQGEDRQDLWDAIGDTGWNPLYKDGVSLSPLTLSSNYENVSFDSFIGMDCPPPNWNEGLDQELTKDLHLVSAFHHLFDHTQFALTDFIYVRQFKTEIQIEIRK